MKGLIGRTKFPLPQFAPGYQLDKQKENQTPSSQPKKTGRKYQHH